MDFLVWLATAIIITTLVVTVVKTVGWLVTKLFEKLGFKIHD